MAIDNNKAITINKINDNTIKLYQYIRPSWKDFSTNNDNCWQWILEKYGK